MIVSTISQMLHSVMAVVITIIYAR